MNDFEWLAGDLTSTAYIWRLERRDGVAIGFISHDRDLIIDDFLYRAAPGLRPSTVAMSDSLDIDNVEIDGVLTANAITDADLMTGRWNGARLELSLVDWSNTSNRPKLLIVGEFGEISRSGDAFRVEILGPTQFLNAPVAPPTSPTCRAEFGDRQCQQNLGRYRQELKLTSSAGNQLDFDGLNQLGNLFALGELRWLTGLNCGLVFAILSGQGNMITLADLPVLPMQVGDRALLTQGCDKRLTTCQNRFQNVVNFRGEPFLPGNDLLTRVGTGG